MITDRLSHLTFESKDLDQLLTAREVGERLRLKPSALAARRAKGMGPPYIKIGRSVRYRVRDLNQWLRSQNERSI